MTKKGKNILLIDGSTLAFLHGNKENYKISIKEHIEGLLRRYRTNLYVIILENSNSNFRNKTSVSTEYKGQRRTEKAITNQQNYLPYLSNCFREIKDNYRPVLYLGIENDDALRILSKRFKDDEYNPIVCANDSDILCIEGNHHNLRTNKQLTISYLGEINHENKKVFATGLYNVYFKIMKGSQKENYKGIPGYGDVKVYSILKDLTTEEEMQDACLYHFKLNYSEEEYLDKLAEGFSLCWILEDNYNLQTPIINDYNEIKLNFK